MQLTVIYENKSKFSLIHYVLKVGSNCKSTIQCLEKIGLKENKLMTRLTCYPDLNPIENLWANLKRRLYKSGQQFTSKDQLRSEIVKCAKEVK